MVSNSDKDRDGARFGFTPELLERRRVTFWDLFVADAWQVRRVPFLSAMLNAHCTQSLMTGRPPVIRREYVDCKFPTQNMTPDSEESEEHETACECCLPGLMFRTF